MYARAKAPPMHTRARAWLHTCTADTRKHTHSHRCTRHMHTCTLNHAEHACRQESARAQTRARARTLRPSLPVLPAPPVIAPSPGVWQIALAGRPPLINPSFSRAPSAGAPTCGGPARPSPAQARNQKAGFRAGHLFAGLRLLPPQRFISAPR